MASDTPQTPPLGANTPPLDDIVSVNDRGSRQGLRFGPFLTLGGIALVVAIGAIATVNVVKAKMGGHKKPSAAAAAVSPTLVRTFASEDAPPIPVAMSDAAASEPICPDGMRGNDLKGQDGQVVRNASGQSVRVCANGQVLATAPSGGAAGAIPVETGARGASGVVPTQARGAGFAPAPQGPMMLNGGQYGDAQLLSPFGDPQIAQISQTRTEGLLTGARSGTLEAELIPSRTPLVQASHLGNLNLLLPKGRTIDCGLSMRIISGLAGQASCVVSQNVYSANGKVLLIERGSEAVGEFRSGASIGQERLFVLWSRIITPGGVVINLDSPTADELGTTGLAGRVDNHWFERIGSAFLLSTIQDILQYKMAEAQNGSGGTTMVFGSTAQTSNRVAERVLETTINIPPTLYKNQGDRAVIYVARDLDFSNVYRLRAKP